MNVCLKVALACLVAHTAASAAAENWPGWRGPRGDGTSAESNVPVRWSASDNIAWKVEVPGIGHSSPIVWGDRIYLTTCLTDSAERQLLCFDRRSGNVLWTATVLVTPLERKHVLNSYASGTPVTDGEQIFVSFFENHSDDPDKNRGEMVIAAYDAAGKRQWLVRPGVFSSVHGYCSSPVLFEDTVIVNGDHDGDAYLVALRKATGEIVWKVPRENKKRSYCTPIIRDYAGRTQLILSGSMSVCSYDPRDGSRIWNIDGPTEQFVASMVDNGRLLFMTCGFPDKHVLAIRPDGKGNVTETHIAWRSEGTCAYVPSPIVVGNYFLVVADNGIGCCFHAETGKLAWRERMGPRYSASLIAAGGLAYFLSDRGVMTVVRPGPEYEVVAENDLGEDCYASPAVSGGQIYIRADRRLYAIGAGTATAGAQ